MKFPQYEAYEITDSRGRATIGFRTSINGEEIKSAVPSGTSAGSHEAKPLPVEEALAKAQELASEIVDVEFASLKDFDHKLFEIDGTTDKSSLGANTILGLSMLFARLQAKEKGQELWEYLRENMQAIRPFIVKSNYQVTPMMVMIEGGVHAESGTKMQELLINSTLDGGKKVWQELDKLGHAMGMEGGFDVPFDNHEQADEEGLEKILSAIKTTQVAASISVDVAANEIKEEERYDVAGIIKMIQDFNLESVEDPFPEDDWDKWSQLVMEVEGHRFGTAIVGDDLTVTNAGRLEDAIAKKALSGVIVKPNQVGSISETLEFVSLAKENRLTIIVSHRSGETEDDFIADLAYAVQADFIKAGAPSKPERVVKYKRLAEIQQT